MKAVINSKTFRTKKKIVKKAKWVRTDKGYEIYLPFKHSNKLKVSLADARALARWILESG